MIRPLTEKDFSFLNNLINDKDYVINEYELQKRAFIYEENEQIVAFISYSIFFERAELNYLFVSEPYRKQKIASKLMEIMFLDLKEQKVQTIDLEVNEKNIPALKLYQKFGFQIINRRKGYYHGLDGLIMQKLEVTK